MIKSTLRELGSIAIPEMNTKRPMMAFDLKTLDGLADEFKGMAESMVKHLKVREGLAFLTIHGKQLLRSETLRRGGAHIDGNYMNYVKGVQFKGFGNDNGFKLGQNGPLVTDQRHIDSYENEKGGIIMASTFPSCKAYTGRFTGSPKRGGDCTHLELNGGFMLKANKIYYGNNRMIHESLPVSQDTHRTFIRVTLPITHKFEAA